MDRHPVIDLEPDPCKRIPIGIHGDDAGAQGDEIVLVVTWGSTAVSLPTLVRRGGLNTTVLIYTIHVKETIVPDGFSEYM